MTIDRFTVILTLSLSIATVVSVVDAATPAVVSTTPRHGATGVDPATTELRVTFDHDMSTRGASWVGGGNDFPQVTAPPRWEGPRVCVLPVALQPDHEYRLMLNGPRYRNFVSVDGEPLRPVQLWFRTGDGEGKPASPHPAARASFQTLREAIDRQYSYRDRLGLDWTAIFDAAEQDLAGADSDFQFAARAATLLAVAEDPHMSVTCAAGAMPTYIRLADPNVNFRYVASRLQDLQQRSPAVFTGTIGGEIGYICIGTWDRGAAGQLDAAFEALDDLAHTAGLIIDVRGNGGGDEAIAKRFAARFVDRTTPYARHRNRNAGVPGGFGETWTRSIEPDTAHERYDGPVVVLMGPLNMSSCEAFLLMMRQVPGCTLLGMRSAGSTGNPKPVELPIGVTVMIPSWQGMTLDGAMIEGAGIAPDVEVPMAPADLATADAALDRAVAILRAALEAPSTSDE